MVGMVVVFFDEDMKNVVVWFVSQKLKLVSVIDEIKIVLGQKLWCQGDFKKGILVCVGCYGLVGVGMLV